MVFVMTHLCIDARMAFSSGVGTYIRELLSYFDKMRVTLLVGEPIVCPYEQIYFPAPIYSFKEQMLFPIKIPPCDLFWSPHYNVPLFPIRAKKRVVTIHDACHLVYGSLKQKAYARVVMGRAVQRSDRIITVSNFSASEIFRFFGKREIDTIPIGVNREFFQRRELRESKRFVLFVGNQKTHKNLEKLKEAVAKAAIPDLELVMVGRGTEKGLVAEEDLPLLYSTAEALIFPSLYEGFGLPPLEAMACGCPTIVSKCASMPEVCGDASLYFDPNQVDEMAEAIRKVVLDLDLRKELIEKGYERVKLFSWKGCAEKHIRLFEEVCHA